MIEHKKIIITLESGRTHIFLSKDNVIIQIYNDLKQAINNDTTKFHEIMDASNTYKLIKLADIESIEMIDC